jgi:hypothetical protein
MKTICLIMGALLVCSASHAGFSDTSQSKYTEAISAVLLDDSPTSYTSSAINIKEYKRVGIYWVTDETEVGESVSATLTVTVSPDGVTYIAAPFFDVAGGATPQTSEALSADGSYICWLDPAIPFNYLKVTITGTATDADDTSLNTVKVYQDK